MGIEGIILALPHCSNPYSAHATFIVLFLFGFGAIMFSLVFIIGKIEAFLIKRRKLHGD